MNPVVHFEMPAIDNKRVKRFYENVFGWKMTQLGKDMGDYILATTSPLDENNMHKNKGAINGGFYKKGKEGTVKERNERRLEFQS
jgi:predicted enzyme related to lactoylglutathione lyase